LLFGLGQGAPRLIHSSGHGAVVEPEPAFLLLTAVTTGAVGDEHRLDVVLEKFRVLLGDFVDVDPEIRVHLGHRHVAHHHLVTTAENILEPPRAALDPLGQGDLFRRAEFAAAFRHVAFGLLVAINTIDEFALVRVSEHQRRSGLAAF